MHWILIDGCGCLWAAVITHSDGSHAPCPLKMWPEGGRPSIGSNSDVVESSVRELGIKQKAANENDTPAANSEMSADLIEHLHFCEHRSGQLVSCSRCEKIAHQIRGMYVSEEENVAPRSAPPHPAGVKLTRPGYYTIPSLDDMINYIKPDGRCVVPSLTIGRKNYGSVHYDCAIDVTGLDLDHLVHFLNKEVIVYPDDSNKPPVGHELNRRAIVTLDRVWPRDKTEKRPITEPDRLFTIDYEGKLKRVCEKHDTKFIEYRPETGSWVFRVEHFSKYGLTDSDEEDEPVPQVLRRQLVKEPLQQSGAPAPSRIPVTGTAVPASTPADTAATCAPMIGLGGLGGALFSAEKDPMFAMQQTSCDLLGGLGSLGRGGNLRYFIVSVLRAHRNRERVEDWNLDLVLYTNSIQIKNMTTIRIVADEEVARSKGRGYSLDVHYPTMDDNEPNEQAGFRRDFSTIVHVHIAERVMRNA
ncbi:Nuclear pore complex protein Nup98-Nup96 [Eumeta japonica]|uniref:Nuclear pore complex protein Nup98-Nup96 n=1 Tax=Eumeta variegata TaxID=151549 RepID=A0A4C1VUH3_EUMVA|nr:Nuclear pore complex protein Nup98-Nup96 [Eumeta japonica]